MPYCTALRITRLNEQNTVIRLQNVDPRGRYVHRANLALPQLGKQGEECERGLRYELDLLFKYTTREKI